MESKRKIKRAIDAMMEKIGIITKKERNIRNWLRTPIYKDYYPIDPEAKLLWYTINNDGIFFDIGANKGTYSKIVGSKIGKENTFCFEPIPKYYNELLNEFEKKNVSNAALSSSRGESVMRIPYVEGSMYNTRATLKKNVKEEGQTGYKEIKIETETIDSFVVSRGIRSLDAVKIDVEGHELEVIKGGLKTIKKLNPIMIIEIEQRHHKQNIQKIFRKINNIGYELFYIDIENMKLENVDKFRLDNHQDKNKLKEGNFKKYINNFILVPKDRKNSYLQKVTTFFSDEIDEQKTEEHLCI